jgi:hypothetical protein
MYVHHYMYIYCFFLQTSARIQVLWYTFISFMHNVTLYISFLPSILKGLAGLRAFSTANIGMMRVKNIFFSNHKPRPNRTLPPCDVCTCIDYICYFSSLFSLCLGIPLPVPDDNQSLISEGLTQPTFQPPRKYLTVHGHNFAVVG